MKLEEYPTPVTDTAYFSRGATMYSMAGEMKQLERKLAKCRNVLNGLMLGFEIIGNKRSAENCRKTLDETKP